MIVDALTQFCSATSAILAVGNAIIGNVVDRNAGQLSPTLTDLGTGEPVFLVIIVTTAFVGATSTTKFELASDSVAALTTSKTIHWASSAIAVATLVAGYTLKVAVPQEVTYERYVGIWETVATADVTAGAISAFLTRNPQSYNSYPNNYTIS